MLRFVPDSLGEGLLRPFVMADPLAGVYFEASAPDWRFAALLLIGVAAWWAAARRRAAQAPGAAPAHAPATPAQRAALWGLALTFAFWTGVIGNGRYFIAGLLWVGPLLVLTSRRLPGGAARRWLVLALLGALQLFVALDVHVANRWGLVRWGAGPGVAVAASPLRESPAVFLTFSGISYSLLVPAFHSGSRWVNLVGQTDIAPAMPEFARVRHALASGLPIYAVGTYRQGDLDAAGRLRDTYRAEVVAALAAFGYAPAESPCILLASPLVADLLVVESAQPPAARGFWFCHAVPSAAGLTAKTAADAVAGAAARDDRIDAALDAVERRCPRFFPPGTAVRRNHRDLVTRMYPSTDSRLHVVGAEQVLFRHVRAMNPTLVGPLDDVLAGRFTIPCDKLPGRYQLPWQRD